MKCAVFSCLGLGDGLLALILANNLQLHGFSPTLFHPFLQEVQAWFPHIPIKPFPPNLEQFDRFFLFYEKTPWMEEILQTCLQEKRETTTVLNPIATPHTDYPFWEEGEFDGSVSFAENLVSFCRKKLLLTHPTLHNGITPPSHLTFRKNPKRIVIHPTSSRPSKNWPKEKFLQLARQLEKGGWEPVFVVSANEKESWPDAPLFPSLADIFSFVYESQGMIGNDSGIGHLASCLGLPTLTLCRNKRTANFWRPSWGAGKVILPSSWLPNIKGMRWRDTYWDKGISVKRVYNTFSSFL